MSGVFGGDVPPQEAWERLTAQPDAVLLDVRTQAEWVFVGGPDLSGLDRPVVQVEWQRFPGLTHNQGFVEDILARIATTQPIYIICRSGVRSRHAAEALAQVGYTTYNIADGFEGQINPAGHRGVGGWRALGLPWRQS
jgi:rhodanese-related sulfurtransferase